MFEGDGEGERAAVPRGAFHANVSMMALHYGAHIAQPETEAFHIVDVTRGHTVEFVEDPAVLGARDPDPIVAHRNRETSGIAPRGYHDTRFLGGILDGVVQQVVKHIGQVDAIALHMVQIRAQIEFDPSITS